MPRNATPPVSTDPAQEPITLSAPIADLAAANTLGALTSTGELPDPSLPAINPSEPAVSFKIDFADKSQWFASHDGGATKTGTGNPMLIGRPIDLALQLSQARWGDDYDQRLRLAFLLHDGSVGELNLNAVNRDAANDPYITSPVRSLAGGLLAISEAQDDIVAFCRMARFSIRPGRGRGVFIDVDVASGRHWVAMSSAPRTNLISKEPSVFHAQLALIKQRFRSCGLLLTAGAVVGDIPGYDRQQRLLSAGATLEHQP
ncbi:hypothetical protein [Synechococcus sp. CBW1004]|uniref:hypothetical protein n=1 Tax=Synechococcus sp. CBW1004 TaxID=1353136 RepID=UPI0018CEB355|nr:hypothetical protein [Synechococcus sp. CBW1004]QPN61991.1 hypothetical protein H8F25_09280 [Synechococcus sp. CBW1004]